MNISKQSKDNAVKYISSEIKDIICNYEPRVPGSVGENQALDHMQEELSKLCGAENTMKQSFPVAPRAFFGWTFFVAIFTMLGNIVYFFTPVFSILCYVIAILPMFLEFVFYKPFIDPLFEYGMSANVMGTLKPTGETKKRIVFNGHSDAVYEWHWHRVGGYKMFLASIIIVVIGFAVSCISSILATILEGPIGTPENWLYIVGYVELIFFPFYIAFFYFCDYKTVVPGANDNLTACEMAIAAIKVLKENDIQLENTEVVALITGSEEAGLRGAKAFCKQNPTYGKEEGIETIFVTYETLRELEHLVIYNRDMNGITKNDDKVCDLAKRAAADCGMDLKYGSVFAGATDAAAFSQAGLKATCLAAMDPNVQQYYHTRYDNWDNLSEECLSKVLDITIDMIDKFDKNGLN